MIRFKLNGQNVQTDAPPGEPLLQVLSNDFQMNGQKFGCGKAQCGACTVQINGDPVRSCVVPLSAADGRSITTVAGLAVGGKPSRLQQAFIDEQAVQCGYCINGMIMQAKALLERNRSPSDEEIRAALAGNLCRCGTHVRIVRAVKRAASTMA